MALFDPCMEFEIFLGQMTLFEVLLKCHSLSSSKTMSHAPAGIYILLLSTKQLVQFLIFTENGKVLAKLCKDFSNVWKLFHFFQDPDKKLVLALYCTKFYLRKNVKIGRKTTGDLNKSTAVATFQKKRKKKVIFSSIILEIQLQIGIKIV